MKKDNGFTLIELMAVVAIMGILSAAIIPALGHRTTKNAILKVKDDVSAFLTTIIERSYEEGQSYTVEIDPDNNIIEVSNGQTMNLPAALKYAVKKEFEIDGNELDLDGAVDHSGEFEIDEKGGVNVTGAGIALVASGKDDTAELAIQIYNIEGISFGKVKVYMNNGSDKLILREGL